MKEQERRKVKKYIQTMQPEKWEHIVDLMIFPIQEKNQSGCLSRRKAT